MLTSENTIDMRIAGTSLPAGRLPTPLPRVNPGICAAARHNQAGRGTCRNRAGARVDSDTRKARPEGIIVRKDAQGATLGVTQVTATVRNPAEPDSTWEGLFLVDTGAIDSLVPRQHLEAIGLKPKGQRVYGLADGSEVRLDVTTGDIEFMGDIVGSTIVFGEDDSEPLLGVTALESVGIEVDPRNQRLTRLPSTRLKSLKRKE